MRFRSILGYALLLLLAACNTTYGARSETSTPGTAQTNVAALVTVTATPPATATIPPAATPTPTATSARPVALPVGQNPGCTPRTDWPIYAVVRGDTLAHIASRTGSTVNTLVTANCLLNADRIEVGQQIRVPNMPAVTVPPTLTQTPDPQTLPFFSNGGLPPVDRCHVDIRPQPQTMGAALYQGTPPNALVQFGWMAGWADHLSATDTHIEVLFFSSGTRGWVSRDDVILNSVCDGIPAPRRLDSVGDPTGFSCVAYPVAADIPLFSQADIYSPMNAILGNWAHWEREVNDLYEVIVYPDTGPLRGYVQTMNVNLQGPGCPDAFLPPLVTQGTITVSSYIRADAGIYTLRAGEQVTLRWQLPPDMLQEATFYTETLRGTRVSLGTDTTPGDGFAIQWTVPANLEGERLFAEGAASNPSVSRARTEVTTVYSANTQGQCIVNILGDVPVYAAPDLNTAIIGQLSSGMNIPYVTVNPAGWLGIQLTPPAPGAPLTEPTGWLAPGSNMRYSASCPINS